MLERYYFFFHYCLLSCRYVMFQKRILSKLKWGAQAVVRGSTATLAPPRSDSIGLGVPLSRKSPNRPLNVNF